MTGLIRSILCAGAALAMMPAQADIITRLPTEDKVIALTFDACEAGKVSHLDHAVADYLIANRIPFTVFLGGKFVRDNADDVKMLSKLPFVELENHSWSHNNNMPALSGPRIVSEVLKAERAVGLLTGARTTFFRFPAGKTDAATTALVEGLGYQIVHWRWAEGDPDPHVSAKAMIAQTMAKAEAGDILIFHINGRGVHTAEAIPAVVEGLKAKGFRFVLLRDYLNEPAPAAAVRGTAPAP